MTLTTAFVEGLTALTPVLPAAALLLVFVLIPAHRGARGTG